MEKIDVVYILGKQSKWMDNEIRYSLRSLEKNFPRVKEVFVIGERPEWLTNITHIPASDPWKNKLQNAKEKYQVAINDERIGENFVLMNDDFYILKEVNDIPFYARGTLKQMIARHKTKGGYYYASLVNTYDRLHRLGYRDPIDYEVHAPIIFNKQKLKEVIEKVGSQNAYSLRSCYGNIMEASPVKVMDFKAANIGEFFVQKRSDREYLSTSDRMVSETLFLKWIKMMFKKPSKYEIDTQPLEVL